MRRQCSSRPSFAMPRRRRRLRALLLVTALALLVALALPALAQATTITWTHGTENYTGEGVPNTDWNDYRNWEPEQVPGPGDHVIVARDRHGHYPREVPGGSFASVEIFDCSPSAFNGSLTLTEGDSHFDQTINALGTLTVEAGATLRLDGVDYNDIGGPPVVNYGTITGSGGISGFIHNYGTVTPDSGILDLRGDQGGTSSPGSTIGGGAGTVQLKSASPDIWTMEDGSRLAGGVDVWGDVVIPLGATADCSGANSAVCGANFHGPGTLHVEPGATLYFDTTGRCDTGFTLDNHGTVVSGQYNPVWDGGTLFDNSGVLDIQDDAAGGMVASMTGGRALLVNTGSITSEGDNPLISLALDNQGTISVPSGNLQLQGGSSVPATGDFLGTDSGVVNFAGNTWQLADGVRLRNAKVGSATTVLSIPESATVTMEGANTIAGPYPRVEGPGTLRLLSGATFTTDGTPTFAGGLHFDVEGILAQIGSITVWDAGTVVDNSGTVDIQGNLRMNAGDSGVGTIVNSGTIAKSAGTGEGRIYLPLDNRGVVSCSAGRLLLCGGSTAPATGEFTGGGGEVTFYNGEYVLADGATLSGSGVRGGTLTLQPGITVPFNGTNTLAGGTVKGAGTALVPLGATLAVGGSTALSGGLALDQRGTLDFAGNYSLTTDGTGTILNSGTITKSLGTNTSTINPTLANSGTISVPTGRITLPAGKLTNYDATTKTLTGGAYAVTAPGLLRINNGDITTLAAAVTLSGAAAKLEDSAARNALRNLASVAPDGRLGLEAGQALSTVPLTNQGYLWIGEASTLSATNGAYTQAAGQTVLGAPTATLAATGTGAEVRLTGGFLTGCGTVSPALTNSGGYLRPEGATQYGTLSVAGPYSQGSGGTLLVDIASPAAGSYDTLAVSGAAALGGQLVVTRARSYQPAAGDSFAVLTAAVRNGTFAKWRSTKRSGSLPAPFTWEPSTPVRVSPSRSRTERRRAPSGTGDAEPGSAGVSNAAGAAERPPPPRSSGWCSSPPQRTSASTTAPIRAGTSCSTAGTKPGSRRSIAPATDSGWRHEVATAVSTSIARILNKHPVPSFRGTRSSL